DPMPEPSAIEDVRLTDEYIAALRNADLYNGDLSAADIERLLNPPQHTVQFNEDEDRGLLLSLRQFLAHIGSSEDTYRNSIASIRQAYPDLDLYSLERIKKYIADLTGVVPIVSDMCPGSCHAYTGPLADRTTCLKCGQPRYDSAGNPLQRFYTLPPTSVLQSMHRDPKLCHEFGYANRKFDALIEQLRQLGAISDYDDVLSGSDILDAFLKGRIKRSDILLMLSLDGAQIYQDKQSDCWIYIWVFTSLSPDLRYKKRYVVPGGFIPGPHKPKLMDSYMFPGLHHIAALNKRGGLPIWNALLRQIIVSRLFILLAGGDGPAITHLNGLVGTAGKRACRFRCGLKGRRKPTGQAGHHYPCLSRPLNYVVADCDHPDVLPTEIPSAWIDNYATQLEEVRRSSNQTEYKSRRAETGICKASILSGLEPCVLGAPKMFPGDIMHLVLNLGDLLVPLWRGKFERAETDPLASWDWAVLTGERWTQYGREVAAATPYLPGSFDRPPRNPAEKINSGYKAWEYLFLLFGLGPGQLYKVLPDAYWESFCKLARGMQIIYQYEMPYSDVTDAHSHLVGFSADFEAQYVRRMPERVHFVRQSIHILSHFAPEILRIGPGICSSQWTMERCIGNLVEEIRQHSTFYQNLSERGAERCRVNALSAMVPQIVPETQRDKGLPRGARDAGGGFVFLRARSTRFIPSPAERAALRRYLDLQTCDIPPNWETKLRLVKWARLRLPNGQIARSAWKESLKPLHKVRMSRNVKRMLCMAALYTRPDADLYRRSSGALWSCSPRGEEGLAVVEIHSIGSVVAMVPHSTYFCGPDFANRVFAVEKPGLAAASL
ncbi:hypothetical protein EXIGLDRAFT_578030, partial [Exidia glandulosa HHB12029]